MKYWKQGFYDQPVEGAVEITEGKWRRLLDGQARGMKIVEDENGMPVLREPQPEPTSSLTNNSCGRKSASAIRWMTSWRFSVSGR